jgi:SAM-dependent methyltransferase
MKLNPQDLEKIASLTLDHYDQRAEEFWQGTRDHDVKQNIAALLQWIEGKPPFTILDFGCGPGRDLKVFSELGHVAVGLEGAAHFAVMARTYSGCEVWLQDFLKLDLPDNHFDGVYANASLFHVPSQELPRVLLELHDSLKLGGVPARIRAAITRKVGVAGVTARIMISKLGAAMCQLRDFLSLITITALPVCHAKNSLG